MSVTDLALARERRLRAPRRLAAVHEARHLFDLEDPAFDRTTRLLGQLLTSPVAALSLVEAEGQFLRASVGLPVSETTAEQGVFCRTCVDFDDVLEVQDARLDERFSATPLVTGEPFVRFYAGAPVHGPDGTAVATLCVVDTAPRSLTDGERRTLLDLRDHVEELLAAKADAGTDPLTHLPNRRQFEAASERSLTQARRAGRGTALLMLDVDHFKAYNDCYGHPAGDEVLREVGRALTAWAARGADLVARVGGEEFAAVLDDVSSPQAAAEKAHQLLVAVRDLQIPHAGSNQGFVTVSIGVVHLPPYARAELRSLAVKQADEALYAAKRANRNTVVCRALAAPLTEAIPQQPDRRRA